MKPDHSKCCEFNQKTNCPNRYKLFIVTLILALLPKCPFCIFAYSTTIVLCSKTHTEFTNSPLTILITCFFCLLIIGSMALNFRGKRTWTALALSSVGSIFIIYSVAVDGGQILYYTGILILFFGIWYNGSFLWFYNKITNYRHTTIPSH